MNEGRDPSEVFRERLRAARELRDLSQARLAAAAGLPATSIAHFEAGARKPSFDSLRRLANALQVTTDYLLGRADDPSVAEAADPLFRDVSKLTEGDRELARDFLKMLSERREKRED